MRGVIVQFTQQLLLFLFKGGRGTHGEKKRFTLPPAEKPEFAVKRASRRDMCAGITVYCSLLSCYNSLFEQAWNEQHQAFIFKAERLMLSCYHKAYYTKASAK